MSWKDLDPDEGMLRALRTSGHRPVHGTTTDKRKWGKTFADQCARELAIALAEQEDLRKLEIRPRRDGSGTESLTGVGGGSRKKVDVIASNLSAGLQLAVSLKAENFSGDGGTYGKNFLNRVYELQDEVRSIHEYQPRAYMVGIFYFPLSATTDRAGRSTFARAVAELRGRTGRVDLLSAGQLNRLDMSVIGLYVPAEEAKGGIAEGVARYFDVHERPPKTGRPRVETTLSLAELVYKIDLEFDRDPSKSIEYTDPEPPG